MTTTYRRSAPWAAFSAGPLLAVSLLAACSHQGPREFDVSPQGAAQVPPPPEAPAANLAGTWQFNPRESDQPGQYGRGGGGEMGGGRRGGMGGRGGMPGGGGRGAYPGGRGGGMPPSEGGRGEDGQGARGGGGGAIVANAQRLVIAQTDSSIAFTRPTGAAFSLFFDGRDVIVPGRTEDESVQVNGRWHRRRFEVRREISNQRTVTESFELSSDGSKLTVRTKYSGSGDEGRVPEMRRVYDKVPGDRGQEPGERN